MADIVGIGAPARPGVAGKLRIWWGDRPYAQALLIAVLFVLLAYFGSNVLRSMHARGMEPNFDYLWQRTGFDIDETLIPFTSDDNFGRAILVGLLNTVKLAFFGCIFATILGVTLGVIRLSGNLLLSRLVQGYVELIRNTPLTLQLFFWIALTQALPQPRQALQPFPATFLSIRGIFLPWFNVENGSLWPLIIVLVVLAVVARLALGRRQRPLPAGGFLALLAAFPVIAAAWILASGIIFTPDLPALQGFNIRGGLSMSREFAAMLLGLTLYYAASISESVRSGIESVGRGQWEAGTAIGLSRGRIMRLIVFPQAMRVITPLMTSSFLDLTKDTSLGPLIGFFEVTQVIKVSANKDGNAVATIIVLVIVFLAVSLPVSYLINLYNRRLAKRGIIAK
ncbi:amino acid ABC transporter permease [Labrys miyagiensis]